MTQTATMRKQASKALCNNPILIATPSFRVTQGDLFHNRYSITKGGVSNGEVYDS